MSCAAGHLYAHAGAAAARLAAGPISIGAAKAGATDGPQLDLVQVLLQAVLPFHRAGGWCITRAPLVLVGVNPARHHHGGYSRRPRTRSHYRGARRARARGLRTNAGTSSSGRVALTPASTASPRRSSSESRGCGVWRCLCVRACCVVGGVPFPASFLHGPPSGSVLSCPDRSWCCAF